MMESSRLRDWQLGGEDPVAAQEGPQDAGSSAGQGNHGLDVLGALAALLERRPRLASVRQELGWHAGPSRRRTQLATSIEIR